MAERRRPAVAPLGKKSPERRTLPCLMAVVCAIRDVAIAVAPASAGTPWPEAVSGLPDNRVLSRLNMTASRSGGRPSCSPGRLSQPGTAIQEHGSARFGKSLWRRAQSLFTHGGWAVSKTVKKHAQQLTIG